MLENRLLLELLKGKKLKDEGDIVFDLRYLSASHDNYNLLDKYAIEKATVTIAEKDGRGLYLIDEPPMNSDDILLYRQIMKQMFLSSKPLYSIPIEKARAYIKEQILAVSDTIGMGKYARNILEKLMYYITRDMINYGILGVLMLDPDIEDIMAESYNVSIGVVHRRFSEYGILNTNILFPDSNSMNAYIQKLVQRSNKTITAAVPYVDAITDEGHRISATFGREISLPGPTFTIRKFSIEPYTIADLMNFNTITPLLGAYIWLLLDVKALILIIGPTASGKTTSLSAIISMIHPAAKITTIEDTPELRISHEHWQRLVTRKGYSIFESKYDVEMNDLIKLALRSRPDYIIVGEIRGEEVTNLVQAAATGHGGITSFHASDAKSALVRLASPPLNVQLAGQMLIWCFIRQNKVMHKGKMVRRVTELTEVIPVDNHIELRNVFEWNPVDDTYSPDTIDELVKRSHRLKEVIVLKGYSEEDLKRDLDERRVFLEHIRNEKKRFSEIRVEFSKFYAALLKGKS